MQCVQHNFFKDRRDLGMAFGFWFLVKETKGLKELLSALSQQNSSKIRNFIFSDFIHQIQYIFTILKAFRPIETLESLYVPFICQLAQLKIDRVHCVLARFPSLQTGIVGDPLRIPNIFTSQNFCRIRTE